MPEGFKRVVRKQNTEEWTQHLLHMCVAVYVNKICIVLSAEKNMKHISAGMGSWWECGQNIRSKRKGNQARKGGGKARMIWLYESIYVKSLLYVGVYVRKLKIFQLKLKILS